MGASKSVPYGIGYRYKFDGLFKIAGDYARLNTTGIIIDAGEFHLSSTDLFIRVYFDKFPDDKFGRPRGDTIYLHSGNLPMLKYVCDETPTGFTIGNVVKIIKGDALDLDNNGIITKVYMTINGNWWANIMMTDGHISVCKRDHLQLL